MNRLNDSGNIFDTIKRIRCCCIDRPQGATAEKVTNYKYTGDEELTPTQPFNQYDAQEYEFVDIGDTYPSWPTAKTEYLFPTFDEQGRKTYEGDPFIMLRVTSKYEVIHQLVDKELKPLITMSGNIVFVLSLLALVVIKLCQALQSVQKDWEKIPTMTLAV